MLICFHHYTSGRLIVLSLTHSPEATAETTHRPTLRKWAIKMNLNLNIRPHGMCKIQSLETNLGPLISPSGTDPSTLKTSAFDLAIFTVVLVFQWVGGGSRNYIKAYIV